MNRTATSLRLLVFVVACCLPVSRAHAQALSCGAPPPAKPHRIKGGESFPPLPLPVTPLRRTERKRSPAPPLLIAKLNYGEQRQAIAPDGQPYSYYDWKSDPADAHQLLAFARPKLGINYRVDVIDAKDFQSDPSKTPILYITGHQGFTMPEAFRNQVHDYVMAGGTLVAEACCGSGPFIESFTHFAKELFPNRRLAPLPPEHPLFRAFFPLNEVTFQEGTAVIKTAPPEILGVEVGCRVGVFFSRYDLSCGWDGHVHDAGHRIEPSDALRLGTNMLAYCLANQELGRFFGTRKVYHEENAPQATDAFVFGQVVHEGDWDPDPNAVANLLKAVNRNSAINVTFVRKTIDAMSSKMFEVPFLYMTGHHNFTFSDQEVQNMRAYLANGGFLLADACCGRPAFDAAFRREVRRVLPNLPLEPIPADSAVYNALYPVQNVHFSLGETAPPAFEGIRIDGFYAVVYSPNDLGNGWEGVEHPYVDGIAPEDSLRLAMNVIMYALTH